MATETTNYKFKKPAGTDFYNIEDQNGNWDIADSQIKAAKDAADEAKKMAENATVDPNDLKPTYTPSESLKNIVSGETLSIALGKIQTAITSLISHIGNKSNPHGVTATQVGAVPVTEKGPKSGVATLDGTGKVPAAQLPAMDYDAAGAAAAVDAKLTSHTGNKSNPHGVTATQINAIPTAEKGAVNGVASLGSDGKVPAGQLPKMDYAPAYTYGTEDLEAGVSPLAEGVLYFCYE